MRTRTTAYALALLAAFGLAPACGGEADVTETAEAEASIEEVVAEVDVPSEEEAAEAAAEAIDESNLDAEFEALQAEIEADGG